MRWAELSLLFFIQAAAIGAWLVPMGGVLDGSALSGLKPLAFATSAVAAFVSPLIFGSIADRRSAPVLVLRWLAAATALSIALAAFAVERHAPAWLVLTTIQLQALCAAPTWSLTTSIVFSRLADSSRQFGPLRSLGSIGWMAGCWVTSAIGGDTSIRSWMASTVLWSGVVVLTFWIPQTPPRVNRSRLTLAQMLGWDAMVLLRCADHRAVFLATALFTIPLAAFYPYTPSQLRHLGLDHVTAWMTLAQTTEVAAMLFLSRITPWLTLKWTLAAGIAFGLIRFAFCALDSPFWVLLGLSLHGVSFTLVFITAQIYLEQKVAPEWRVRAQSLMSFLIGGVGNLLGFLGSGALFAFSQNRSHTPWPLFWGSLSAIIACILVFFVLTYRESRGASATAQPPSR
jgi:MFS family permease